jgi:hypothetical protein
MDSARKSRGQLTMGPLMIPAIAITVAIVGIVAFELWGATAEEFRTASEQTTTVCNGMWNCGAAELIPPLVLVLIAALIISVPKRVRSDDEE